jgi:hypothetical protein
LPIKPFVQWRKKIVPTASEVTKRNIENVFTALAELGRDREGIRMLRVLLEDAERRDGEAFTMPAIEERLIKAETIIRYFRALLKLTVKAPVSVCEIHRTEIPSGPEMWQ